MDSNIPIHFQTLVQRMHVVSVCLHYFIVSPNIIWLPWQRPLSRKRGPDRSSASKTLSVSENIAKIGPADSEIIVLRVIIKKENKKRKKLTQPKYIALLEEQVCQAG